VAIDVSRIEESQAQDSNMFMAWPPTREEVTKFEAQGLKEVSFEHYLDKEDPPVWRFRIEYTRGKMPSQL